MERKVSHAESKHKLNKDRKLAKIKVLNAGSAFGERALVTVKPRNASIICEEDCHFAVLDRDLFKMIIGSF